MLTKYLSVGSAFAILGAALWGTTTGCSSSDTPAAKSDAGTTSSSSSSSGTSNTSSSSSSTGGTSSGDGGLPAGFKDPNTVPGVTVTYGTCPAFTKCDGSVVGSWTVSGGCLSDTTFDQYKALCAGLNISNVIIKASGTVVADDTTINRQTSAFVQAQVDIDKTSCAALEIAGGSGASCSQLDSLLTLNEGGAHFDNASCSDGATANTCTCIAQATVADNESDTYTASGGTLTCTNNGNTRTFDYCPTEPAGTPLTYHETTDKNPTFGMFLVISKNN